MKKYSEHKELLQEFSKTFNIGVVDICNFINDATSTNEIFRYVKELEKGLIDMSNEYHNQCILVDDEYIKIDHFELNDSNIIVVGTGMDFYTCDYREEIELTYDCSRWLTYVEMYKTTLEDIRNKIEMKLISVDEMKNIFNENFDKYRERFYHHMFGIN